MRQFMDLFCYLFSFFLLIGIQKTDVYGGNPEEKNKKKEGKMSFTLKSNTFQDGDWIPSKYTCDGDDISPNLYWEDVPEGTQSFAIICDDPDAPVGVWDHWVIYDIPDTIKSLDENVDRQSSVLGEPLKGVLQGVNSWNRIGYGGPCPPGGSPHRYFFKIYALDTFIKKEKLNKNELIKEMEDHIVGETQLMGKYQR